MLQCVAQKHRFALGLCRLQLASQAVPLVPNVLRVIATLLTLPAQALTRNIPSPGADQRKIQAVTGYMQSTHKCVHGLSCVVLQHHT